MERRGTGDPAELDRLVSAAYCDRNVRNFLYRAVFRLVPGRLYKQLRECVRHLRRRGGR
jgi:hypothetical protein